MFRMPSKFCCNKCKYKPDIMSSPKYWGKHFWTTFHIVALGYPRTPTPEDIATYKSFYQLFGAVLPCKKCARNYERHMEELPIDRALSSKDKLFAWTVDFHNIVNRETGKPFWNKEYSEAYYTSGAYNDCICDREMSAVWQVVLIVMIVINLLAIAFVFLKKF